MIVVSETVRTDIAPNRHDPMKSLCTISDSPKINIRTNVNQFAFHGVTDKFDMELSFTEARDRMAPVKTIWLRQSFEIHFDMTQDDCTKQHKGNMLTSSRYNRVILGTLTWFLLHPIVKGKCITNIN